MISYCNNVADTVSCYIRIYRKKFTRFKFYERSNQTMFGSNFITKIKSSFFML